MGYIPKLRVLGGFAAAKHPGEHTERAAEMPYVRELRGSGVIIETRCWKHLGFSRNNISTLRARIGLGRVLAQHGVLGGLTPRSYEISGCLLRQNPENTGVSGEIIF